MKNIRLLTASVLLLFTLTARGQAPQRLSFQAVVRDAGGNLVANSTVGMRISILRGSPNGSVVFAETHQPQTNANGLASLEIGGGTPTTGFFSAIDWALGPYFLKTETDPEGSTDYGISGISQLLSVPYSLHAKTAENGDQVVTLAGSGAVSVTGDYPNFTIHGDGGSDATYEAGTGIAISGNTISNAAPDLPVTISGGGATQVGGAYPNFSITSTDANTTFDAGAGIAINGTTISNAAPDIPVNLTGSGATSVSGAYPNFTISSTDANTTYDAGAGIAINGTTISNTSPDQVVSLMGEGTATVSGTYPNFTITSTGGTVSYTGGTGIEVVGTTINNTSPDVPISLTGAGSTVVSGSYPDFTITSTGATVGYTAGAGIDISGTTISNSAPDQPVTLTGSGATTVSGAYPNFNISSTDANTTYNAGTGIAINGTTISNAAPDVPVNLTGSGATSVSGAYPNFTISSTDANTTYNAGAGIAINGTTITNTAPNLPITLSGSAGITIGGAYPNFTVSLAPASSHYAGEIFGGGIIFYTYDNGQHGLAVSLTDLGTTSQWNSTASYVTNAASYYDGGANTPSIVAAQGSGAYAAKLCDDYVAGGFSDWYLPSLWELNLLFQNSFMVSYKLAKDGNPGTSPLTAAESYWSSTEFNSELSYMVYFPDGMAYLDFKDKPYRVRAIRRF